MELDEIVDEVELEDMLESINVVLRYYHYMLFGNIVSDINKNYEKLSRLRKAIIKRLELVRSKNG